MLSLEGFGSKRSFNFSPVFTFLELVGICKVKKAIVVFCWSHFFAIDYGEVVVPEIFSKFVVPLASDAGSTRDADSPFGKPLGDFSGVGVG